MFIENGHLPWCPLFDVTKPCHCKTFGYVIVALLALFTAWLEIWEGWWKSFSLMLLADGSHVSSDMVVYMIAIWGNVMAIRGLANVEDVKNRWAIRNANVLIAVAIVTMAFAVERMFFPQEVLSGRMLVIAFIGLAVNVVMCIILKALRIKHEHHGEEHEHHSKGRDLLHDTTIWHTVSDSLLSLVVVSVAWSKWKFPALGEYHWIEPAGSLAICAGLIFVATKMKREIRGQMTEHHFAITRKFSIKFRF